jgi:hypothetical protein
MAFRYRTFCFKYLGIGVSPCLEGDNSLKINPDYIEIGPLSIKPFFIQILLKFNDSSNLSGFNTA